MTAVAAPTSIAAKKGITTPGAQLTTTASAQPSDWNPDLNTALTGSVLGATLFGGLAVVTVDSCRAEAAGSTDGHQCCRMRPAPALAISPDFEVDLSPPPGGCSLTGATLLPAAARVVRLGPEMQKAPPGDPEGLSD
ncbi:hypothetical protein GCM10009664_70390 [Kitasatospora gansuensis]